MKPTFQLPIINRHFFYESVTSNHNTQTKIYDNYVCNFFQIVLREVFCNCAICFKVQCAKPNTLGNSRQADNLQNTLAVSAVLKGSHRYQ